MGFQSPGKLLALLMGLLIGVGLQGATGSALAGELPGMNECRRSAALTLPRDLAQVMESVVIVQNGPEIGSGVLISESGHILTAAHLVHSARQVAVYLNSGDTQIGQVLRVDAAQDLALLKISGASYSCLPMVQALLPPGSRIFAIGFLPVKNAHFVLNEGKIQANDEADATGAPAYIRTDMALRQGSSGGPLLDEQGRLVGIISAQANPKSQTIRRKFRHAKSLPVSFSVPARSAVQLLQSVQRN